MTLDKKGIYPIQVSAECVKCGLCVKCCPGLGVDFDSLNREIFGKIPQDPFLGHVISSYIGCALESSVRQAGASGGTITAIGSSLLSTGQLDGNCVVRASNEDPLLPDIFIAKDADDVLSEAQSKYYPVPISQGLEEIMTMRGRFAIVGKPCDIHGIRKAAYYIPEVRKRIVFTLGIMCMCVGGPSGYY
jgi:coenzyme F420 hydrogenase subunit beta